MAPKPVKKGEKVEASTLTECCLNCGKPISLKGKASFTGWLFQEVRCSCNSPRAIPMLESIDADDTPPLIPHATASDASRVELGDSYEVLSLLGHGGMGYVYKVKDKTVNKDFAIKVLRPELASDEQAISRFQQEVDAVKMLTHPNLVSVYGQGRLANGTPYLVMDYLEGECLAERIAREGHLPAEPIVEIMIQVCQVVKHAHSKGVIHRDLKPSNIILSGQGGSSLLARVVDFGIAKVLPSVGEDRARLTQTGEVFGSPQYMSPEQCKGENLDGRSDIYSMGCIMYEALTGRPPFVGSNPVKTILAQIHEEPRPPSRDMVKSKQAAALAKVLLNCLEKDPKDRYQNISELEGDLHRIKLGRRPEKRRPVKWLRRANRRALTAVTVPLLLLAAAQLSVEMREREYQFIKSAAFSVTQALTDSGRPDTAEFLLRTVLKVDENVFGPDSPKLIADLEHLSANLTKQQRPVAESFLYESRTMDLQELAAAKEHKSDVPPLVSINRLAMSYARSNDFLLAEKLVRDSMEENARAGDKKRLAYDNLMLSYIRNAGGHASDPYYETIEKFKDAYQIRRSAEQQKTLTAAENLANNGFYADAAGELEKLLDMDRQSYGEISPEVALDLFQLANTLWPSRRIEAQCLYLHSLAIADALPALHLLNESEKNESKATALMTIGGRYLDAGLFAKAEPLLKLGAELAEKQPSMSVKVNTLNLLANVYRSLGNKRLEQETLRRLLSVRDWKDEKVDVLDLIDVIDWYARAGLYEQSQWACERLIDHYERSGDKASYEDACRRYASLLRRLGKTKEAAHYEKRAGS
ncbi:MAG TPA: serine/threonine-protein kinase [Candidatus Obscuribacterales bacterium]